MYKVVLLQTLVLIVVAIFAGWVGGMRGCVSAAIGGIAYILPNTIFVFRLTTIATAGRANPVTFFVGELGKIIGAIAILVIAQKYYDVHWLTMLLSMFVVLKANLFAFLLKI